MSQSTALKQRNVEGFVGYRRGFQSTAQKQRNVQGFVGCCGHLKVQHRNLKKNVQGLWDVLAGCSGHLKSLVVVLLVQVSFYAVINAWED